MDFDRPILVTGAPRTGTSWVGRTLSGTSGARYIHEPFNISAPRCRCGLRLDYWFYYAKPGDSALRRHMDHLLASPVHPVNLLNVADALLSPGRRREGLRRLKTIVRSLRASRCIIKDPLALFSAQWMAIEFDMFVVILIRHPAAFVSSYKSLNWSHSFTHFLQQPDLLHECLQPFIGEIERFARESRDLIDQASLLWRLIHFQIHSYRLEHPDWIFVRYEDLARDPLSGFADLFQRVGLPFTKAIHAKIDQDSAPAHQDPVGIVDPYSIQRNSQASIGRWKHMLDTAEIARIRDNVSDISALFYSEDEWS